MKVECIKIINPNTKIEENKAEGFGLKKGKEYLVLEIYVFTKTKEISFRLDNGALLPVSAEANQFKMTCNKIPSNWVSVYEKDNLFLGPQKWLDDSLWKYSFWEDYLNEDSQEAEKVFIEERQKIIDEVG